MKPGPFLLLFLAFSFSLRAQLPNPNLFSTATNASGNGTLAILSNDLNWTASLNSASGPFSPCKVLGLNPAWATSPYPNASWISYNHTCTTNPAEHNCDGDQIDEYYRLIFNLPAQVCGMAITTPSAYCLDLDFLADNSVNEILVNGVLNYTNTTLTPFQDTDFQLTNAKSVSLCKNWSAGSNTLIVHIKSGAPSPGDLVGFLAQANQTLNPLTGKGIINTGLVINQPCPGTLTAGGATISTPSWGTGPYTYSWSPSGGTTNISSPLSPGNYTCKVNSGNDQTSCLYTVNILAPVSPSAASQNSFICKDEPCVLIASGGASYTWSTQQQGSQISLSALPLGANVFTVNVSLLYGCPGITTLTCSVKVFRCVGLEETDNEQPPVFVFPNPAKDFVVITLKNPATLTLINSTGLIVKHLSVGTNDELNWQRNNLPGGIYHLVCTNASGTFTQRIVLID